MSFVQYLTTLAESLRFITISDLLDIVILSYVVYKGINILQRTNAAKVAKALLLILVVMWLSYQFNLNTINFVLSKAVELGLLALVIIFQPEIRRFLERIGSNNVSRIFRNDAPVSELETAINETVECGDTDRDGNRQRWTAFNADYWREVQQRGWLGEVGTPGGWSLTGRRPR